ncbi:hypothetical protein, partial [Priestia megaterium]|uniref:hypothetical protein n=1 Tax=Priestia megaterium TaxID=1404 RepID=UPI0035B6665C
MQNRRELFSTAAAFGLVALAPRMAQAAAAAAPTGEAAKMYALFDRAMDQAFRRMPELPTYLG